MQKTFLTKKREETREVRENKNPYGRQKCQNWRWHVRDARNAWRITIPDTRTWKTQVCTKELGVTTWPVMKRTQPVTIRYSADAADAKSCKAEETKQRIETDGETINRDRAMQINANNMWEYQDANRCFLKPKSHETKRSYWQIEDCTWTKSYLINLHCVYSYITSIYIIYKSIYFFYIYRCTFPMIGYLTKRYSLDLVSIVRRYFFNLLFHLRSANSLRKNEIKLMFFPKSHILFAEEGRPVGPIDWCAMIEMTMHAMGPPWGQVAPGWSVVSRVTEKAAWHWDVHLPPPIYHHTTTRAQ